MNCIQYQKSFYTILTPKESGIIAGCFSRWAGKNQICLPCKGGIAGKLMQEALSFQDTHRVGRVIPVAKATGYKPLPFQGKIATF